jgi:transposase
MEVFYPNCAGLDVHKETVVACSRQVVGRKASREVRTFKTTTSDLLALSEWLSSLGCTHIAMEATGVYWKPVWHILGDCDFALTLANAAHVKNVPGRKTDVNDATWLADLLAHGLIRGSFVPDEQTLEQRGLLRTRKQLIRERTSHVQRLQKTLEEANIKLDCVISDIVGTSGRAMIEALVAGETDPAQLARLANRRIRASATTLQEALRGRVRNHHRFLLRLHLEQIDALDRAIAEIDREVEANLDPFRALIPVLTSIPGIGDLAARVMLAEIGTDMSRFPAPTISNAGQNLSRSSVFSQSFRRWDMKLRSHLSPRDRRQVCFFLESGAHWPVLELAGAQRRTGPTLAARWFPAPADDSRARSAAGRRYNGAASARSGPAPRGAS